MYFNQGGYRTGKIIFQIDKTIFNADDQDKADKLINFNFDIKDFVILNYFTDRHIFKGATDENPYVENLHFGDKTYTFKIRPQIFNVLTDRNRTSFVPYGQTDSGALQHYA